MNSSLQGIYLGSNKMGEALLQEIESILRGRLDWNVVVYEFFPLLGWSSNSSSNMMYIPDQTKFFHACFADFFFLKKYE